jgi:murein DD-endopeptidase MepM/ murein hydrolase activator NlpD
VVIVLLALQVVTAVRGVATPLTGRDPGTTRSVPRLVPAAAGTDPAGSVQRPSSQWQWPLEPVPAVVRRFQPSPTPWGAGHRGVDLAARTREPVRAAGAGVVSFSGVIAGQGVLAIQHGGGLRTTYQPVDARLPAGTTVAAGQQVGVMAATPGHCVPAVCLHWGLLSGSGRASKYLDPLSLFGLDLSPPVLLPVLALSPSR